MTKKVIVGVIALCAVTGIASANLLSNGDFNTVSDILDTNGVPTGNVTADNWEAWAWGNGWSNTEIPGWGSPGGTYMQATGASGGGGGGVFQTVAAIAGQEYQLTVDSGADAWWLPTGTMIMFFLDEFDAEVGQVSRNTVDPAVYGDNYDIPHPWETYSLTGTAPVGTTQIKVELTANNATGSVGFDNADLQAIPEPATLGLLGLSGLALWIRRKLMS